MRLAADLGEFALFVSGRTADVWWPDDEARTPLLASIQSSTISYFYHSGVEDQGAWFSACALHCRMAPQTAPVMTLRLPPQFLGTS